MKDSVYLTWHVKYPESMSLLLGRVFVFHRCRDVCSEVFVSSQKVDNAHLVELLGLQYCVKDALTCLLLSNAKYSFSFSSVTENRSSEVKATVGLGACSLPRYTGFWWRWQRQCRRSYRVVHRSGGTLFENSMLSYKLTWWNYVMVRNTSTYTNDWPLKTGLKMEYLYF